MSRFLQLHLLTSYPPANLNRDDLGRPKTAKMGGFDRLRVSSQSLKRAWRSSDMFEKSIAKGIRTKMIGVEAFGKLSAYPALSRTEREDIAKNIAQVFGKLKANSTELETLAFISEKEQENIDNAIRRFEHGLGAATEDANDLGVKLYEALSQDIRSSIRELMDVIKGDNPKALLKSDWDKPKGMKEIVNQFKKDGDKSPNDFLGRMIEGSAEWVNEIAGDIEVRDDQLEMFFSQESVKLAKEIVKKLSLGALLSGKNAKETVNGELMHKDHIGLCKGWEEQVAQWVDSVQKSEDDDFTSEQNIELLKLAVSPVAISKSSILSNEHMNADIAMFGRMLASSVKHNVEAACQVAHAISVHPVVIEDDYFTAVEEMNKYRNDAGASHIGETGFAAGLFYSYICINRELLVENLGGDQVLADRAIRALTEAAVKVAPEGKQNSFASRAYANFVLAEKGDQQPRSLSVAFLKPVTNRDSDDFGQTAVEALVRQQENMDKVYGDCADQRYTINAFSGEGSLSELLNFTAQ